MAGKVYVGDFGVLVSVDTGIDLTSMLSATFLVLKPNGLNAIWNVSPQSPPNAGVLVYTTVSGDFDVAGNYLLQVRVLFTGSQFTGETATFRVYNKYE